MAGEFERLGAVDNPDRVEPVKTGRKKAGKPAACNVPACRAAVYHRGLCDEHWASRRDLADPDT